TKVNSRGVLEVESDGLASGTTVNAGGFALVTDHDHDDDGILLATTDNTGGVDIAFDGGIADKTTVLAGGEEVLEGFATKLGTGFSVDTDIAGGLQVVFGESISTTVNTGTQIVWSGGLAEDTTINKGAFEFVVGDSEFATVNNGGTEFVVSHGFAEDDTINSGGVVAVNGSGSEAFDELITRGGNLLVSGGGLDLDATVSGTEIVQAGGTASGAFVVAGGLEVVSSGGDAISTAIEGGSVVVQAGGSATATFDNTKGGSLQVGGTGALSVTVSDFASPALISETIDFTSIGITGTKVSFVEAATGTSGTLTVSNATQTASLTLLGSYSTANFAVTNDGNGGTLVTDPPALVGSASSPVLA